MDKTADIQSVIIGSNPIVVLTLCFCKHGSLNGKTFNPFPPMP